MHTSAEDAPDTVALAHVPAEQFVHDELPAIVLYVPGLQFTQTDELLAPNVVLYVPAVHLVH